MNKSLLLFFFAATFLSLNAQERRLTETSLVKDTSGKQIPYILWSRMLPTGRFNILPEKPRDGNTAFILTELSDEEYERRIVAMPAPQVSNYFITGAAFSHFQSEDIEGN